MVEGEGSQSHMKCSSVWPDYPKVKWRAQICYPLIVDLDDSIYWWWLAFGSRGNRDCTQSRWGEPSTVSTSKSAAVLHPKD
ncbi:hypothetical protein GOP47_0001836 [Adiantum capillus-veneris]|uniref:Uncharacterized protein n=1 Tax=Adiantum capillus-veneris TaxID=13818 RepID=A0A9D4V9G3_ADICA|nr:hypothetical protein GOP47_0001836 [Adiantum capillus-veneris]